MNRKLLVLMSQEGRKMLLMYNIALNISRNGCAQLSVAYKDLQACKALICDSWKDQLDWATSVAEKVQFIHSTSTNIYW